VSEKAALNTPPSDGVYTAHRGNNADLMVDVCRLYLKPGSKVADITYGRGVFWRKFDLKTIAFHPSDKLTCPKTPYDFTDLPYKDGEFDVVVFDPPYAHNPGNMLVDSRYRNAETTRGFYHDDIIELYRKGMTEGRRILKPGGLLWVKCKDELESSVQRWSHLEIASLALSLKLYVRDLFILVQSSRPTIQHTQQHARKNHSYLWILESVKTSDKRLQTQISLMTRKGFGITSVSRQTMLRERQEMKAASVARRARRK
jgi:hypothetical protein